MIDLLSITGFATRVGSSTGGDIVSFITSNLVGLALVFGIGFVILFAIRFAKWGV